MLLEMFELMAVLEPMCEELAERRARGDEKSDMNNTYEQLKNTFERSDHKEPYTVNLKFYDQLYAAAHKKFLAGQPYRLRRCLSPCRMPVTYQPGQVRSTLKEYLEILNAVN